MLNFADDIGFVNFDSTDLNRRNSLRIYSSSILLLAIVDDSETVIYRVFFLFFLRNLTMLLKLFADSFCYVYESSRNGGRGGGSLTIWVVHCW